MSDFSEAAYLLIKHNHIIPSLSLIRTLFENLAITYRIVLAVEISIKSKQLVDNFDDLITKISFGTGYKSDVSKIHILTNIDKLDKDYNDIRKYYDAICEFVHPNWDGLEGGYSELSENEHTTEIKKMITVDDPIYKWIEACFLLCLNLYIDFSRRIFSVLPNFAKLCEM